MVHDSEVKARDPSLGEYLDRGKEEGVDEKHPPQRRAPRCAKEERQPPLFLCTYINRKSKTNGETFRFILNHSKAIAANVYLLLYPKKPLADAIKAKPELVGLLWQMLKSITPEVLRGEGRVYGGKLYKMGPKEIGNGSAQNLVAMLPSLAFFTRTQTSFW